MAKTMALSRRLRGCSVGAVLPALKTQFIQLQLRRKRVWIWLGNYFISLLPLLPLDSFPVFLFSLFFFLFVLAIHFTTIKVYMRDVVSMATDLYEGDPVAYSK